MPNQLINTYYNALHRFKQYGGSQNETTLEHAFISLVNSYAERQHLLLVPKISVEGKKGNKIIPDGVLKNALRLEFGYWESKDSKDDLDREIHKKLYEDGYPDRNILFEDTKILKMIDQIVAGVVGHDDYGDDSALYEAFGFVRKSKRKSGLKRGGGTAAVPKS